MDSTIQNGFGHAKRRRMKQVKSIEWNEFATLNKKGLQEWGELTAKEMLDSGDHYPDVLFVQARKAKEYLESFIKAVDSETRAKVTQDGGESLVYGCTLSLGSSGDRFNFEEDFEYSRIKAMLKDREELLRVACKAKESIYDSDGGEVPRVGIKSHSKEMLKAKL